MNDPAALRVLLVEDSDLLCERFSELVEAIPGVELAASVATEGAAIDALRKDDFDVVVLDLQLHRGTGFGVMRRMKGLPRRPAIVVLTNFALKRYRDNALALGARHFLDKARDYERLPGVLRELSAARH
jgi:DNA-binding NarL/FixJ family response regulator